MNQPGAPSARGVSMDVHIEYLLSYLEDELRDLTDLRIHPVAPASLMKSPDLPQDYDPESGRVHLNRGVRVRVSSRDYFFPVEWVMTGAMDRVQGQAREIRQFYEALRS